MEILLDGVRRVNACATRLNIAQGRMSLYKLFTSGHWVHVPGKGDPDRLLRLLSAALKS